MLYSRNSLLGHVSVVTGPGMERIEYNIQVIAGLKICSGLSPGWKRKNNSWKLREKRDLAGRWEQLFFPSKFRNFCRFADYTRCMLLSIRSIWLCYRLVRFLSVAYNGKHSFWICRLLIYY